MAKGTSSSSLTAQSKLVAVTAICLPGKMEAFLTRTGYLFYVISPNASSFKTVEEVPEYTNQAIPVFLFFIAIDLLLNWIKGREVRLNDSLSSLSNGVALITMKIILEGIELIGYQWLYEHRFLDLDWNSPVTWLVALLGVDLGYYWFHRMGHEMNLFWALHQVHHSSQEYNLTTALRQSAIHSSVGFGYYQPLALLGVPLPAAIVHIQLNTLFQFWIHTENIKTVGPLEWVLNTPSHHRVHHGANKWCLDKNYAGVFIIWDRLFGTFQPEIEGKPIDYGLVDQPQTFDILYLQCFYLVHVLKKAINMKNWKNQFKAIFYGPAWVPGAPRLGDLDSFDDVKSPRAKYNPRLPFFDEVYLTVHFFILLIFEQVLAVQAMSLPWTSTLFGIVFILISLGNIGAMYDGAWWAPLVEAARCLAIVMYGSNTALCATPLLNNAIILYCLVSSVIWAGKSLSTFGFSKAHSKIQ